MNMDGVTRYPLTFDKFVSGIFGDDVIVTKNAHLDTLKVAVLPKAPERHGFGSLGSDFF